MKYILMGLVRLYQLTISKGMPASCRFTPSCSRYGYEAISRYGTLRGSWMAIKRVGRCQPMFPGGYDPVPDL